MFFTNMILYDLCVFATLRAKFHAKAQRRKVYCHYLDCWYELRTVILINVIKEQQPTNNYNLVTLLIGVNNQYQNREFGIYEREFPQLAQTAIALAKGNKYNVIVVSIPDYAYTPFGQQFGTPTKISTEIDKYNAFAKSYCDTNGITFINITDITRQGLKETYLVATDGLHPSEKAYSLFVDRIAPKAKVIVQK